AELRQQVLAHAPDTDIRLRDTLGNPDDIHMVAVSRLSDDLPAHVRVTRLKPDASAREIAEYMLAHILRIQRNMDAHTANQTKSHWHSIRPRYAPDTVVGVLGLGHIGGRTARMLRDIGFQVKGWSRSPKTIEGIETVHGPDTLAPMLSTCDYVAAILPSTSQTNGLLNAKTLSTMKPGSTLLNAGRGALINQVDLIECLNTGPLGHAVLDVTNTEPLPPESPLWRHPNITITPHVSGWHLGDALKDVAENHRRLMANEQLLHEVDRAQGY
ncbi:MAG: glyoxylate/hydroxypyruvate reductase A, partial [Granulosicoccus sp.]